jgi:hypothetical protein
MESAKKEVLRTWYPFFLRIAALNLAVSAGIVNVGVFIYYFITEDDSVWSGNLYYYLGIPLFVIGTSVYYFLWLRRENKIAVHEQFRYLGTVVVRYTLAYVLLSYAYAKFLGMQFQLQYSDYDMTIGEASGIRLAWSFFGYSVVYSTFIGASQVICSVLLFFKRTVLLATLILLPIMMNITLMDFTHHIEAHTIAIILLYQTLILFSEYLLRLKVSLLDHGALPPLDLSAPIRIGGKAKNWLQALAILICLVLPFVDDYMFKEKYVIRTPILGAWTALSTKKGVDTLAHYFKIDTVRTKLFVEDGAYGTLVDEKGRGFYQMNLDGDSTSFDMTFYNDSLSQKKVKGRYKLLGRDTLEIVGRQGKDSIHWLFRRRPTKRKH